MSSWAELWVTVISDRECPAGLSYSVPSGYQWSWLSSWDELWVTQCCFPGITEWSWLSSWIELWVTQYAFRLSPRLLIFVVSIFKAVWNYHISWWSNYTHLYKLPHKKIMFFTLPTTHTADRVAKMPPHRNTRSRGSSSYGAALCMSLWLECITDVLLLSGMEWNVVCWHVGMECDTGLCLSFSGMIGVFLEC